MRRSIISEPINIVTGALGSGKTLFAIQQADLLRKRGDAKAVYQVGINGPDLRKLPALPFPLEEWHIHADAGELDGAVIIIDEFHKWMPQRSQGSRPPRFVEEMAEARRRGVRFILLTQSGEFDHFLKGTRLNRHFYISRKSGLGRSTIWEWMNRFVSSPEENKDARKAAIIHRWKHPVREYGDWYESAKSHHFRVRIPLRLLLVPPFILAVAYFGYKAFTDVGGLITGSGGALGTASAATPLDPSRPGSAGPRGVITTAEAYLAQFQPVVPSMPYSAPVFQGRQVATDPQLYCVIGGVGTDAQGRKRGPSCGCYTEQMTPYVVEEEACREIARHGFYNPFRNPFPNATRAAAEADGKAASRPRPPAAAQPTTAVIPQTEDLSNGRFGVASAP